MQDLALQIEAIRAASREFVRQHGFMQDGLAGTDLHPSTVHALLEISMRGSITASQLSELLLLDLSSVTAILQKLITAGTVREEWQQNAGEPSSLTLTLKGQELVAGIHEYGRRKVSTALSRVPPEQHVEILKGLRTYNDALAGKTTSAPTEYRIEKGYQPGLLARCLEIQIMHYASRFGRTFEAKVGGALAEFAERMDKPCNAFYRAVDEAGRIVGTIAIDGEDLGPGKAHLRWFIVQAGIRGKGLGRQLLEAALKFCDEQAFERVQLWTIKGLDAARHLYESYGFVLAEEFMGTQWGKEITEYIFIRQRSQVLG